MLNLYNLLNNFYIQVFDYKNHKKNILQMFIYMHDENDYETMNIAFDSWIPNNCAPARATFGNIKFPNNKWKIEIVVSAYIE
jgi:enamine deaminase RidA (YjgF/YER057c/UK114 family)